jgi:hypothetical protein
MKMEPGSNGGAAGPPSPRTALRDGQRPSSGAPLRREACSSKLHRKTGRQEGQIENPSCLPAFLFKFSEENRPDQHVRRSRRGLRRAPRRRPAVVKVGSEWSRCRESAGAARLRCIGSRHEQRPRELPIPADASTATSNHEATGARFHPRALAGSQLLGRLGPILFGVLSSSFALLIDRASQL